jgi:hypothetical protein
VYRNLLSSVKQLDRLISRWMLKLMNLVMLIYMVPKLAFSSRDQFGANTEVRLCNVRSLTLEVKR